MTSPKSNIQAWLANASELVSEQEAAQWGDELNVRLFARWATVNPTEAWRARVERASELSRDPVAYTLAVNAAQSIRIMLNDGASLQSVVDGIESACGPAHESLAELLQSAHSAGEIEDAIKQAYRVGIYAY